MTVLESYFNNEWVFNGFEIRSWTVGVWGSYWVTNIPHFLTFQILRMGFRELDNLWLLARLSSPHVFGYLWPWLFGYLLLPWPVYLCFLVQGIPGSLAMFLWFLGQVISVSLTGYLWLLGQVFSGSLARFCMVPLPLSLVPLSSYHLSLARLSLFLWPS